MSNVVTYEDRVAIHPGYYLKELVEDSGLTQEDFARRLGTTPKNLGILIRGEQTLSIDMASKLSRMLGTTVTYWLKLQQAYDEKVAEFLSEEELKREREVFRLMDYRYYCDNFGLPEHPRKTDEQIRSLREFLGVSSLTVLEEKRLTVSFRRSTTVLEQKNIINANAMVQVAVNRTLQTEAPKFNHDKLEKLVDMLPKLQWNKNCLTENVEGLLHEAGVVLVRLPDMKNAGIRGAAKRVNGKVMLMVSEQKNSAANTRFTVFHEIGHILNGDFGITCNHDAEDEADAFARQLTEQCER